MFTCRTLTVFAMGLAIPAVTAQAQTGPPTLQPSARPVTSPYLNLAIDNEEFGGPTYQYFQQVRPRLELRRENRRLENEIRQMQRRFGETTEMDQSPASGLGTTGHPTGFQSYRNFFPGFSRR